ncbi:MAG: hypothetical protein KGL39_04875 [Patescibacteria group bacterium]|nr:hypothetical protein [Patescibacteria group bacterium]
MAIVTDFKAIHTALKKINGEAETTKDVRHTITVCVGTFHAESSHFISPAPANPIRWSDVSDYTDWQKS